MKFKKHILAAMALAAMATTAHGQVANYCLNLQPAGSVDCGPLAALDNLDSYTVQLWLSPETWTPGATVLSRGEGLKIQLGDTGALRATVGASSLDIASSALSAGAWAQLTLIVDKGAATALINGTQVATGTLAAIPAAADALTLGGDEYAGRLDEVRLWNAPLENKYDLFVNTTLNEWTPQRDNLLVYYKFDYNNCENIVEYVATWNEDSASEYNNHGIMSKTGVSRQAVTDNAGMPYIINSAYTANERFWDRAIEREPYLLANDLIILGIQSYNDGHLDYVSPVYHADLVGTTQLDEFEGREGVLSFDGNSTMTLNPNVLNLDSDVESNVGRTWTIMNWIYIDEWVEGAYIYKQETTTDEGTKGLSLSLGSADTKTLLLHIDGTEYYKNNAIPVGTWTHLAITPNITSTAVGRAIFSTINGTASYFVPRNKDVAIAVSGTESTNMVIGEGFKGKIDETSFWKTNLNATDVSNYSKTMPMPGIGKAVTADVLFRALAYYTYDNPEIPGWDSYSQDEWGNIMRSAYDGYQGYKVRLSVKSHSGWQTTISNAARRKIFAEDLARLIKDYDGAELDLEWANSVNDMNNLGLLAVEIRNAIGPDKIFMISNHCYYPTYCFPLDKMQYVDGFTFQVYGPQSGWSSPSTYAEKMKLFLDYGYPADKILLSYAATTSQGYNSSGGAEVAVSGVRTILKDNTDYVPSNTAESVMYNGYRYYFTGPVQTYNRTRDCITNGLGGIFYWDMGNDMPFAHEWNLAKWSNYAANCNVDRIVESVSPNHVPAGIESVWADGAADGMTVTVTDGVAEARMANGAAVESVRIYNVSGAMVAAAAGSRVDIEALPIGVYLLQASANGNTCSAKIVK